ncbi:NADPH:adrenodoxin oxidoreductase-like protein [Lasiosphaeris hirsuta]|uniref:NADPH:adrenodoxin oxidoreductase, mitochondrial n=1 Tax=Lasiosphaeris hirsuta TaxID=260670 RepID=A0AA40DTK3_9PEZI|nr:NADPH:adrenodoxin oxidoreductase-like protein [Lasiosphaeris hirsuta]
MISLTRARPRTCTNWQRTLNACCSAFVSRGIASSSSPTSLTSSHNERPCRIAVIGSGPAGFYTAYRAMAKIRGAKVDMYESLPVPFGLVRFGVAPDHPEVKNCQEKFEEVAASPNFTFVGNVSVGSPSDRPDGSAVSLASILRHYNAVVFAYGASMDRTLGIPGEAALKGVYSAREFVGWYNGLPEYADLAPDLTRGEEAVIIGQGNVALDVARMLLEDVDVLRKSDIAAHALETLSKSRVERVHVVGRRGPMQRTHQALCRGLPPYRYRPDPYQSQATPPPPRRLMDILLKGSPTTPSPSSNNTKSWSLDFCLTPKQFLPRPSSPSHLGFTEFERTTLSPTPFDPHAYALGTGATVQIPSSLAFRSIGYKSAPLHEFAGIGIPFDAARGVISNDGSGRVQHDERTRGAAMALVSFPGLYCAGWVKRGPTGVIASTMQDAFATADAIAEDWAKKDVSFLNEQGGGAVAGWEGVQLETGVDKANVVSWEDWRKIDGAERERGRPIGKEREKFITTSEMLAVVR